MDETQARGVIKYLPKKGMTPKEMALDEMVQEFKKGRVRTDDDPRSYPPKTSTTDDRVDAKNRMVLDDKCLTVQQMAKSIGISSGSVHTGLTEMLWMNKLSARWTMGPKNDDARRFTGIFLHEERNQVLA